MKNTRKGFTLIEILVTIVLLAIVGAIVIYNVAMLRSRNEEENKKKYEAAIQSAASVYADEHPDAFNELHVSKAFIYIKAGDLIDAGYLDANLRNPETGQIIGRNELVKVSLDSASGGLMFTYPVTDEETENFLVSLDEWIVWGEPYNCFHGAGTYSFALSDESGNLMDLTDQDTVEKYHLSCTYPSDWTRIEGEEARAEFGIKSDDKKEYYRYAPVKANGQADTKGGIFQIEYSWLTESGVRKKAKRTVVVQNKAIATLKGVELYGARQQTGVNFGEISGSFSYTPEYVKNDPRQGNKSYWKYLGVSVELRGADKSTASYTIMKHPGAGTYYDNDARLRANKAAFRDATNNNVVRAEVTESGDVVGYGLKSVNKFEDIYIIDDGMMDYYITTTVKGHFIEDYTYPAYSMISTNELLKIPEDYIELNGDSNPDTWYMDRTVKIPQPFSPVGIYGYKVVLVDTINGTPTDGKTEYVTTTPNSEGTVVSTVGSSYDERIEYFTGDNVTLPIMSEYNASAENSNSTRCSTSIYSSVQIVPINENGYVGTPSTGEALNVTNRFGLLISKKAKGDLDCDKGCEDVSRLGEDYQAYLSTKSKNETTGAGNKARATTTFVMKDLSCRYCSDKSTVYVRPSFLKNRVVADPTQDNYTYSLLGIYKNGFTAKNAQGWSYLVSPARYMSDTKTGNGADVGQYSLATINEGRWVINTCDGTYSTGYTLISPTFRDNILFYLGNYGDMLESSWKQYFQDVQCRATVGADYSSKVAQYLPAYGKYGGRKGQEQAIRGANAFAAYESLISEMTKNVSYRYDSKYCVPNYSDFAIFSTALFQSSDNQHIYWLAATTVEGMEIRVRHGDHTTIYNTYYLARNKTGAVIYKYYASYAYLKPMMKLSNVDCVLEGDGSDKKPYILAMMPINS